MPQYPALLITSDLNSIDLLHIIPHLMITHQSHCPFTYFFYFQDITCALLSAIGCFAVYFASAAMDELSERGSFIIVYVNIIIYSFHAWNMWCNHGFLTSPPTIMQLVCGANKTDSNGENSVTQAENIASEVGTSSATVPPSVDISPRAALLDRARCLTVNIFLAVSDSV